jgi:hypothetical protein
MNNRATFPSGRGSDGSGPKWRALQNTFHSCFSSAVLVPRESYAKYQPILFLAIAVVPRSDCQSDLII